MAHIYFRIITRGFSEDIASQIRAQIIHTLQHTGIQDIVFQSYIPYWKDTSCGELSCQFTADIPLHQIQQLFATEWQSDTAASQWSTIHLPAASFLWISD